MLAFLEDKVDSPLLLLYLDQLDYVGVVEFAQDLNLSWDERLFVFGHLDLLERILSPCQDLHHIIDSPKGPLGYLLQDFVF